MKKLLFVLLLSVGLEAQSPITGYEVRYYNVGAQAPFQTFPLPTGSYTCNLAPVSSTITANPTTIVWDDPAVSGRFCAYKETTGGPLLSFPVGNYEASLVALNQFGASPESNRAPFVIGQGAATPTGVRIIR
jgi:hypothetical protein